MACREIRDSRVLLYLGLFLVASSFCHCTRVTKLKALDKLRGNSTLNQSQAKGSELRHGRLLIGQNSKGAKPRGTKVTMTLVDVDTDYQADMGWKHPKQPTGQGDGFSRLKPDDTAVERLLKMEPKVECTGDSMKLQVQDAASTPGSLFFVDRGSRLSPLPLSRLPQSCGYTIRSTQRDLFLVAPYDGCFVTQEEDSYVLPLRWSGLPVKMSCPLMRQSSPNPPMVTCHTEGMVVKMEWTVSVAKIKVNLNDNWELLMKASPRCGFSVVVHPEGVVVSVRYAPCLEIKDGMYTLELAGNGEVKISCPSLSPAQPEPIKNPTNGPKQQTETPSKGMYPSKPSHNFASTSAPEPTRKNPAQSAVPQVPLGFPQTLEVLNEKPNQGPKDIHQPQLPYLPLNPNFFYPSPANQDTKPLPTLQPPPVIERNEQLSPLTVPPTKPPLVPERQVPQPFIPLPFYYWPAQPEVPEKEQSLPPAPQHPNGQEKQPFNPYPFFVNPPNPDSVPPAPRPELKPLTSAAPPTTKEQRWQPFHQFPIYPQPPKPGTSHTEPPVTKPPQAPTSEAPKVEPSYPLYPEKLLPEQPVPPKHPVSTNPWGQIYQPLYPYPLLPQGPYQMPVLPMQQPPLRPPNGQAQPLSPWQPEVSKPEAPENVSPSKPPPALESKKPPLSEDPQGQVYQPLYPIPFHPLPEPENQPAIKPPQPLPETPQGQVHQPLYPSTYFNLFYPAEKPTAVLKPPASETPKGQVQEPYSQPFKIPGTETKDDKAPTEKPLQSELPPVVKPPEGQVPHPFNQYYYILPPEPVTLPPSASTQQPKQVTTPAPSQTILESAISQPSKSGIVPQDPNLSSSHKPPVYCSSFCSSGFSYCCPQIAFHQHLHHIVPSGPGSKDVPLVYPGLPFLPSMAYSGFGDGFVPTPLPQKPTEAATTPTSSPLSPQSPPSGNEKHPYIWPPEGNHATLPGSDPSKPTNTGQIYSYIVPNSLHHNWPYHIPQNEELQSLPQRQSPAHYSVPTKTQAVGNEPVNPMVQYEPRSIHSPMQQNYQLSSGDLNDPSGSIFVPFIRQNLQQRHTAKELQPYNTKFSEPKVQSQLDRTPVPYYMLQDAQAPIYNKSNNKSTQPQPHVSGSKKSTVHEQTVNAHSEPKSYVLLQHGPPGRQPDSFNGASVPFRDLVHDSHFLTPKNSKPQHPQNLSPQQPKWPKGTGTFSPLPGNVNYMPKLGDESESLPLLFSTADGAHFVPLPQDPPFSAAHLKPKLSDSFKDFWKPMTPLDSSRRIPPHALGKAFQQWKSAAEHQTNGLELNQPVQREGGNQKQK